MYKPENTTLKNFSPKEVKVTRVFEASTTPPEDPKPAEEYTDKTEDEDNGE